MTAEELMRNLQADPQYAAERAARDFRHSARIEPLHADQIPILADLDVVGVKAASVYDFVGKRVVPPDAVAVFIRHLTLDHSSVVREGLIRALGVPSARAQALEPLCTAYRTAIDPHFRFLIANALAGMARFNELRELPGIENYAALFAEQAAAPDRDGE